MVNGMEGIFDNKNVLFKSRRGKSYSVNIEGRVLVDFIGEKISGALDFISKMLEFEAITSVRSFIDRIEYCNKKIQPILFEELNILSIEILNLTEEKNILWPKYEQFIKMNNSYNDTRNELKSVMVSGGQLNLEKIDNEKLV